jgi:hypothetical protein
MILFDKAWSLDQVFLTGLKCMFQVILAQGGATPFSSRRIHKRFSIQTCLN